jgi:hypothetical protein
VVADVLDVDQLAALGDYRSALDAYGQARASMRERQAEADRAANEDSPQREVARDRARRHLDAHAALAAEALALLHDRLVPAQPDILRRAWGAVDSLGERTKPAQVERAATAVVWALGIPDGPDAPAPAAVAAFVLPDRATVEAEAHQRQTEALDTLGQQVAAALGAEAAAST